MKKNNLPVMICIFLALSASGCATAQKPKPALTAGQVVGAGVDEAIRLTSQGIQALLKYKK